MTFFEVIPFGVAAVATRLVTIPLDFIGTATL